MDRVKQVVHAAVVEKTARSSAGLYDGKVIAGRVIERLGQGQFVVSVAGQRLAVSSRVELVPGQSFSAEIKVEQGSVFLVLASSVEAEAGALTLAAQSGSGVLDSRAADLLVSMGLEPTALAFRLVRLLVESRARIDAALIRRALRNAARSGGDGTDAELALLLALKGVAVGEHVPRVLYGSGRKRRGRGAKAGSEGYADEGAADEGEAEEGEAGAHSSSSYGAEFFRRYFESAAIACERNPRGILTLFNMMCASRRENSGSDHWIILPFISKNGEISGDFRVLVDFSQSFFKKIVISIKKSKKKFLFVVYFSGTAMESVEFSLRSSGTITESERQNYVKKLRAVLSPVCKNPAAVQYRDFDSLSGFCASNGGVPLFRGFA